MPLHPPPVRRRLVSQTAPRWARGLVEGLLWVWAVSMLEWAGPRLSADRADLKAFLLGGVVAVGLFAAARFGRLPTTRRWTAALGRAVRRGIARLEPPAGVAFRLPRRAPLRPDAPRRLPIVLLLALAVALLLLGDAAGAGLDALRRDGPYVLHVVGLFVPWFLFAAVMTVAVLYARSTSPLARSGLGGAALLLGWLGAVVVLAGLPGWVALASFAGAALPLLLTTVRRPRGVYHLYRRDVGGGYRVVTVDGWLRSSFALAVVALLLPVALATGPRLGAPLAPGGSYALTYGMGLSAVVAATWLVVRLGTRLRRLLPGRRTAPEAPLVPTVWWPGGGAGARWVDLARSHGFRVELGARAPLDGFDLVVGWPHDPRHLAADFGPDVRDDDVVFSLQRRFHVVQRRRFFRLLHRLVKVLDGLDAGGGGGYLFCPHAWPVPAMVREGALDESAASPDAPVGGRLVGPPYRRFFPPRLRQYLGRVLRDLDLDVVWWDDRVSWPVLRSVLRVVFENWDQGRHPVLERHFVGITRASVTIQDPDEDDETWLEDPLAEADEGPLPLRARALVIRRDDGGSGVDRDAPAPSTRRPEPILV